MTVLVLVAASVVLVYWDSISEILGLKKAESQAKKKPRAKTAAKSAAPGPEKKGAR